MPYETCPIIMMRNFFKQLHYTFLIRNDFKHRETMNRVLIQMRSAGVIEREHQTYFRSNLKKNYEAKREHKVHLEGVQFEQVRYIIYGYAFALLIAILISVLECLHYRVKLRLIQLQFRLRNV